MITSGLHNCTNIPEKRGQIVIKYRVSKYIFISYGLHCKQCKPILVAGFSSANVVQIGVNCGFMLVLQSFGNLTSTL